MDAQVTEIQSVQAAADLVAEEQEAAEIQSVQAAADLVAEEQEADVIYYNGPIERPADQFLINDRISRCMRTNAILILVTMGGDADAAYRIARCLQDKYKRFSLYVSGYCKSAGTLVALGAHELIISDHGELGPLDVQMPKKDEAWETQSGLTVKDTLAALQDDAYRTFEKFFLRTIAGSRGSITSRTASQIATEMTTGLFKPLYGQVDPLHIGEAGRAMSIARDYGKRLSEKGQNIDESRLESLMSEYPSHGFVIDRTEASKLFNDVRKPTQVERQLEDKLGPLARQPNYTGLSGKVTFTFLSTPLPASESESGQKQSRRDNDAGIGNAAGSGPGDAIEATHEQPAEGNGKRNTVTELDAARGALGGRNST